jgi:branched-chain amino acid transport system permease protein
MNTLLHRNGLLRRQLPTLVLLAVLVVFSLVIHDDISTVDVSITIAIFTLLAISVAVAYGQAGVLSVAQAAFAAIGAYATAIATTKWDLHPLLGLLLALAVPALVAYPIALITERLSHLALAVATLVFGEIVLIVVREGGSFTGGYIGLSGIPSLPWTHSLFQYYLFAWAVTIVVTALYANLIRTTHGRGLQTLRHDVLRARADGVNVQRRVASVFSLSAAIAGLAGWLYAHYAAYMAPESIPSAWSITAILMAVVGGSRFVLGPVVGATILIFLQRTLHSEAAQGLLYGAALVVVLIVAPEGLLGALQRAWRVLRRREAS